MAGSNNLNALILLAGKFSTVVSQGAMLVLIARLEGAAAVGMYTLALAIAVPVFLFAHMRMQDMLASHSRPSDEWHAYTAVALIAGGGAWILSALVALVLFDAETAAVVLPMGFQKLVESQVFLVHGVNQGVGRFSYIARSNLYRSLASVAAVGVILPMSSLPTALWASGAAQLVFLVLHDHRMTPRGGRRANQRAMRRVLPKLLPLGVLASVLSLNQSAVRIILGRYSTLEELGVFAAAAYLVRAGSIVAQAIAQSRSPHLRQAHERNQPREVFRIALRSAGVAVAVGVIGAVGGVLIGPMAINVLYGPGFVPSRLELLMIFAAGIPLFAGTAMSVAAISLGRPNLLVVNAVSSLLLTVLVAAALVPTLGIVGGATAWAAGELCKLVGTVLILHRSTGRE